MNQQLEALVAKARTVAESWAQLKDITMRPGVDKVTPTVGLTQALDELVEAVAHWVAATDPTERVEPLPMLMTVRITGSPHVGRTGVVVLQHTLAVYEVEVFDHDTGDSLGTFAIERKYLEPIVR